MASGWNELKRKILRDVRVEVTEEVDRNFERQAFFSQAWQRHHSPLRQGGHILVKSGALRRSVRSRSDADSITFYSDLPYAAIHNEGGTIRVTRRMKNFFWAKYYETRGGFKRLKDGSLSRSKKQQQLSTVAEFWRAMALKKVGDVVKIPKRRFLGTSPELMDNVRRIIEDNVSAYLETIGNKVKP